MKKTIVQIYLLFLILFFHFNSSSQNDSLKNYTVYQFNIKEEIAPPVLRKAQIAFREAKNIHADIILIHMNTYGGLLDAADSIRTKILYSKIPVYVFIDNNAASAGALISLACNKIYMRKASNIGAATVVNQNSEAMPDKYQSYMRSLMRSTAEARGRNPQIAEAMVDPRIYIQGINDSGKVLTFTTSEALKNGFCDGEAENIEHVMQQAHIKNYKIINQDLSFTERLINFLILPAVSGILIMLIIGGLFFELQSPGIGIPLGVCVFASILYFAPLYLEGLAANWEILLFVVGVILLIIEFIAFLGFGVLGFIGIVLVISGLALSLLNNKGLDFSHITFNGIMTAFSIVVIAFFVSLIASFYLSWKVLSSNRFHKMALHTTQNRSEGYTTAEDSFQKMVGKTGTTTTILRPVGKVIIDSEYYQATAQTGYIDKGTQIKVVAYQNAQLIVEKV